jgi:hypothetical protein
MVRTNLQEFVGDVHVLSNLQVGSNLFANDLAANVLTIAGNVAAEYFIGDGGFLSNIATTLDDIISNPNGNSVSNTVVFISGQDPIANTAIVTYANVGISVSNTNPTGEYQLSIGSNIFVNTHASNVLTIIGSVGANTFIGDGGLLSNIATTLDAIIDQGNTVSNTIQLISGADVTSNTGLVTHKDVGISVSNTEPTGEFQFGVGSNLLVNVYSSNVLAIEGNVSAEKMTLGTITVTSAYGLNHVTAQGSVTGDTISLTNATTGLTADSNIVVGGNVTAETVITSANVEVGDRLKFASNVFVDDLRVADVAANLVTYDKTTGELMDSGGLFANKLAVVSVQPPSALSANTTTIAKHGTYTVTTSSLAANSNAWNAFDGDSAVEWLGSTTSDHVYNGGEYTYSGTSNLFAGNYIQTGVSSAGEWLAIEFPYKTTLRHMKLTPPTTYQQYPASANVYATNDSLTWTELTNWSGVNPGDQQSNVQTIIVNATESYKKYAMVVTKTNGSDTNTALAEWKLFTESFSIDGGKVEMATSAVMGGETTMEQSGPHSRDPTTPLLKKFPEIVFDASKLDGNDSTNTYTQAGYTVSASSQFIGNGTIYRVWKIFDEKLGGSPAGETWIQGNLSAYDINGDYVLSPANNLGTGADDGEWVKLELPNKITLERIHITPRDSNREPEDFKIYGSIDNVNWVEILSETGASPAITTGTSYTADVKTTAYKYLGMVIKKIVGSGYFAIDNLELYGYEEDPPAGDTSVDTTFTSIMNTPQTTGANVYVDGSLGGTLTNRVTGPTVSNTHTTYVSAEKYWELSGNVESNVTLEANTFLSGDQPHAVSVWFNSSNLEANVSNTCVFSISDQEHLNSENLDLQSNTWHNLTYAYQGEGGSRVTYLDGRKVAEDQAEDTFGDYPPFAMTGYSQGGYVVSASSEATGSYPGPAHRAFDNNTSPDDPYRWVSASGTYNTDGSYGGSESHTDVDGNVEQGEWLKIELPHKLKVSYFEIAPYPTNGSQSWRNYAILGSNDDINWYQVQKVSGLVAGNGLTAGSVVPTGTYKNSAFKYFVFIWSNKAADINQEVAMGDLKLYGHRENDLVRLPDPTNVLKYPHIAMTGPAQRGYVASASNGNGYSAFDNSTSTGWTTGYTNGYSGTSPFGATANAPLFEGVRGDYIKLELPHKLIVSQIEQNGSTVRRAAQANLYGSNNDTDWDLIKENFTVPNTNPAKADINATEGYKYLVFQVLNLTGSDSPTNALIFIYYINFYGTGVDSIPIQIGGGNIDKVANFRVYDKFVGEDQALEIWDAQKDEFGRAKSSMTLHKGRLGIGTTEPEGRLAVLDEPHAPEVFPPGNMVADETYFEGHGKFKARGIVINNNVDYPPWEGFNDTAEPQTLYYTGGDSGDATGDGGFNNSDATYSGTLQLSSETVLGPWLILELPYKVYVSKIEYYPQLSGAGGSSITHQVAEATIYGRNGNGIWKEIATMSTAPIIPNYLHHTFNTLDSSIAYDQFAFIATKRAGQSTSGITVRNLKFFGTREQGQSVLHDGQLTLTKSLTVPRIGPALDADDTPRRDRLVVEYNTSTNPTFEGAVRDTSGKGNDGVFYGGASYDANEKAFVFDGLGNDYVERQLNNSGDFDFTVSLWIKRNSDSATMDVWFLGGNSNANPGNGTGFQLESEGVGYFYFFSGRLLTDSNLGSDIGVGKWNHVICTRDGNTQKLYLNGLDRNITQSGTDGLTLEPNTLLSLGRRNVEHYYDGSISNFKLYDCVLTAEEVKRLYDMGRCDEGHHTVNFSKTRVGIGLGDGEAPRAALDVSGGMSRGLFTINQTEGQWYNGTALRFFQYNSSDRWDIGIVSGTDDNFAFSYNGFSRGYFDDAGTNVLQNFTGQHRTFIKDVPFSQAGDLEGLIVSSDQNKYIKMSGGIEAGSNAITTNESLPVVSLSNVVTDKKCFGVISASEDPEERSDSFGNFVSVAEKEKGDTRVYINSVGEGAIWVSNIGGSLEAGDYITTSNVAGYGQKQNDDVLHNYTVAKITMDCDFEPATQPVQQILRSNVVETYYLGNVHKVKNVPHEFVTTTVTANDDWSNVSISPSDTTYAEWSNLEANTQNTYTLTYTQTSNVVYDTKYTLTTTANVTESDAWDRVFVDPPTVTYAEYSNLEANTQNTYTLTYTQTTTDEKTPDEWSTLESNVQSLYNKVYYQSVEEEVAATWPGAVAHTRVTDVIENELDEHGQIQWEDHPTDTEKAYKIRYLDASGVQTDSANAVHIAAFVGCTYHCG